MIWKTIHLPVELKAKLNKEKRLRDDVIKRRGDVLRLAIVGGGPKGMYALDTLLCKLMQYEKHTPVEIDWYNKDADFGAGPNYNTEQPDNLLINYAIGNINGWKHNNELRLSLLDWLVKHTEMAVKPIALDFASRAVVGYYLKYCCDLIVEQLPKSVKLNRIIRPVTDINYSDEGINIHNHPYDSIILCTGHSYESKYLDILPQDAPVYEAYPTKNLDKLRGLKSIAIQGMGLSFIDTVITLSSSTAAYDIPIMYPYSRTNLPMLPREAQVGNANEGGSFVHLNYWKGLINKKNINFESEVFPLLNEEVCNAYHTAKKKLNLNKGEEVETFSLHRLLFPNAYLPEKNCSDYNVWVLKYLQDAIDRCKSERLNPMTAAIHKLRAFRPIMENIYAHGGLDSESQEKFDNYWFPAISRVCFGPPIVNAEKLVKLIMLGKLVFSFRTPPGLEIKKDHVLLKDSSNKIIACEALIYAHIPKANLPNTKHELYSSLVNNGMGKLYTNGYYETGAIKINHCGMLLGASSRKHALFAYGTPTESNVLDNDSLSRRAHDFSEHWSDFIINKLKKENES